MRRIRIKIMSILLVAVMMLISAVNVYADTTVVSDVTTEETSAETEAADETEIAAETVATDAKEAADETEITAEADPAAEQEEDPAAEPETAPTADPEKPAFSDFEILNGVKITVTAPEGVFPEGSELSVERVPVYAQQMVDIAVEGERESDRNVAVSYTFDIKVLDGDGSEIQPADEQSVTVSFEMAEAADENLEAAVYHISDEGEAEALDTSISGQTVEAVTDGFSYYTVEFTYNAKTYVLPGDGEVRLAEILEAVGLAGEVSGAQSSNEELFSAAFAGGEWVITSHQSFTTEETLTVTINGINYLIAVTDPEVYYIWVGSTQVTSSNMDDILKDGGSAKYFPDINTLLLENPTITGLRDEAQIYVNSMDLIISGYANLTNSSAQYGIKKEGSGNLVIGVGDITAKGSRYGIYAINDITIGAAAVTATGGENGIYASGDIRCSKGSLTASGKKNGINTTGSLIVTDGMVYADGDEYGISTKSDITIKSGTVHAEGSYYHGIYSKGDIFIDADADVTAKGKQKAIFSEGNIRIYGKADASGGEDGIYSENALTLEAKVIKAKGETGYGIYGSGNVRLAEGSFKAAGNQAGIYSDSGDIEISSGEVTAEGNTYGIFSNAGDVNIANGIDYIIADGGSSAIRGKTITLWDKVVIEDPGSGVIDVDTKGYENIFDVTTAAGHVKLVSTLGYMITFDVQGHGKAPESQFIKPDEKVSKPADPTEEGYLFSGWYNDAGCTDEFDFNSSVGSDKTLYAKWVKDSRIPISTITIQNVPYPVAGEHPVTDGAIVLETGVHMRGIGGWYCYDYSSNEWNLVQKTDTFENGRSYEPFIYLNPEEGYRFTSDLTVTIDDRKAGYYLNPDNSVIRAYAYLPVVSPCDSLYVVTAGTLNVRADADYSGARIGGLKYGDVVQATGQLQGWVLIDYDGTPGWVSGRYVALTYSRETAIKPINYTVTGAGALNVREDISTESKRIGGLTYGKTVLVTGIRTDADGEKWLVMDYDGDYGRQLGYVVAKYTHTDSSVEFTYEEIQPTSENAESAEEDDESENIHIEGVDPVSISMGGVVIWTRSAIAHDNNATLNGSNYDVVGDGTYNTVIYPDDAKNYSQITKDNIILPEAWKLSVMEMILQEDGGIFLKLGPIDPVTVTFETNNGETNFSQVISAGTTVSEPEPPVREGFIFGGWYADPGLTKPFDFSTGIKTDTSIYAKWTEVPSPATYTISYDLNGGTLDGKTGVVKVALLEGTTITLPKPAREGYEFDYWEGSRYDAGASYKVEGDHTFKAQWKKSESSANKPANDVKKSSNDNKSAPSSPKTGDNNKMAVYLILMAAALICPAAVLMLRRRRSR